MDHQSRLGLLNNLPGMAYRCRADARRKLLFASEGCLELTGYTASELTNDPGLVYNDLIHPEDRAGVGQEIEAALREKRPFHALYRLVSADVGERWVWESGRGEYDESGVPSFLEGLIVAADEHVLAVKRVEQKYAEQTRKLSALLAILDALGAPAELPVTLKKALKAALVAARADAGFIHLREKSGKSMRMVVREGIPKTFSRDLAAVSVEDGLVAWVARHRKWLMIPRISDDPRATYLKGSGDLNVYMGVPISRGQRVWGTLSMLGKDPLQFGEEEMALLGSVGEEIGIVVENARLRHQAERLLLAQERSRLARDLHDSVTQSLYSITLFAEAGRRLASTDEHEEVGGYFSQIGETGQQALKEMRLLVHRLRPSILAKEGLVRALQGRLNSVEGRAGVKSQLVVEGQVSLTAALEDALYQIAQEALNNALKHAMASEVTVRLDFSDQDSVVLTVEDNGRGFEAETAASAGGMGLTNMRERVESFEGRLAICSSPGQGSKVEASLKRVEAMSGQQDHFDVGDLP